MLSCACALQAHCGLHGTLRAADGGAAAAAQQAGVQDSGAHCSWRTGGDLGGCTHDAFHAGMQPC